MKARLVLLAALALMPAIASAQRYSGHWLFTYMEGYERVRDGRVKFAADPAEAAHFVGYVAAVTDIAIEGSPGLICVPPNLKSENVAAAVARELRLHVGDSEVFSLPAHLLVSVTLLKTYPCPEAPGP